jgi:glycosyltransferase involved in cell wall biosynthesis
MKSIQAIVPALNEEGSIGRVVRGLLDRGVSRVVVIDNGSTDDTAKEAARAGASVVFEGVRGYGRACQAGIAVLQDADIVLFADGDGCDDLDDLPALLEPLITGGADLCIGSRTAGVTNRAALPIHSQFGNRLCALLMRVSYGQKVTDMGPFRAIRADALDRLHLTDPNFGWNVEMQAKAALHRMKVVEVPVKYHPRTSGKSKITGSLSKSLQAGAVIIGTLLRIRLIGR